MASPKAPADILDTLPGHNPLRDGGVRVAGHSTFPERKRRRLSIDQPVVHGPDDEMERLLREAGVEAAELDAMTPTERAVLRQCLGELAEGGISRTAADLVRTDYKWMPVGIEQFLEDPYYLGNHTKELFPKCRSLMYDVFNQSVTSDKSQVIEATEVILGGALGWGKSTLGALGMTYDLYRMTCLHNPHAFYGIMAGAKIVFACYSVSKEQAADGAFAKILTWVEACPYFREKVPRIGNHTTRAHFRGCPVLLITGSRTVHALGKDVFSFLLDEANFLGAPGGQEEQGLAYSIYNNAKERLRSRFMDVGGNIPGKVWLISSKRTHASFLESHIAEAKDDISAGMTRLYEYSQWEVRDPARFTKPKFRIEVGDRIYPSRVLVGGEDPRPGADVITVPGEYRGEFERDVDSALRNLAGVATESLSPLFRDKTVLQRCVVPGMVHPFTRDEISTDVNNDIAIDTYFRPEVMFKVHMSRYVVRNSPDAPRYIGVDTAFTNDSMGIASVYQRGWKEVRRLRNDGTYYVDRAPRFAVDFVLRIKPPRGSEIDLSKMRAFIISLRDMGLPIRRVTCDGHQSRDSFQILRKLDFDAVLYSVDKTEDAYMTLRQAIVEERLEYYNYPVLIRELSELERDVVAGKVDHPKVSPSTGEPGSKDCSDALSSALYQASIDTKAQVGGLDRQGQTDTVAEAKAPGGNLPWNVLDRDLR